MKSVRVSAVIVAIVSILMLGASVSGAFAQVHGNGPLGAEVSVTGGVEALNKNDTALPDHFVNIPVAVAVAYPLTSLLAAEGEFTWIIPVKQSVDLGNGASEDLKTQNVLAYQANLRFNLPLPRVSFGPYVTAGAGAVTFLSNTDADRRPQLDKSETAFALNFGAGTTYSLGGPWAVRADFREFVAFPSDNAAGLSSDGTADRIWMERGTLGITYRF